MPRRGASNQPERSGLDNAIAAYNQLVSTKPVEKDKLQRSLQKVRTAGELMIRAQEIGTVNFANKVAPLYAGALALNEQGLVQPPLDAHEVELLMTQKETFDLFTQANGETGGQGPAPTDPSSIPTTGRK